MTFILFLLGEEDYQVPRDALLPCLNKLWDWFQNMTATTFIAEVTIGNGYLAGEVLLVTAAKWRF